jgi:hypothetical protein
MVEAQKSVTDSLIKPDMEIDTTATPTTPI